MVREFWSMFVFCLFVVFVCGVMLVGGNINEDRINRAQLDTLVRMVLCQDHNNHYKDMCK